ncbi:hypothetical protein Tco_0749725 [Tanacetum coccineum]|uniref:Myb/SANT-like domain-containing protein n=1 Tax=Tanacetum coccineum TaxID=301880 RepID=A0ABQ4YZ74_9ASTR
MSQEDIVTDEESDSDSDAENIPSSTLEESSKSKPLKKFTYITEFGKTYQMTEEEKKNQKGIEELAKAERKGLTNLKVYRDDDTTKVIYNFKVSDLHIGKWKEVLDACLNRTGAGWKIIYTQMRQRLDHVMKNWNRTSTALWKNKI